jgi:hypothetical protein
MMFTSRVFGRSVTTIRIRPLVVALWGAFLSGFGLMVVIRSAEVLIYGSSIIIPGPFAGVCVGMLLFVTGTILLVHATAHVFRGIKTLLS